MRHLKRFTQQTAAWIMASLMVITTVNLPVNAIVSNAEENFGIEAEIVEDGQDFSIENGEDGENNESGEIVEDGENNESEEIVEDVENEESEEIVEDVENEESEEIVEDEQNEESDEEETAEVSKTENETSEEDNETLDDGEDVETEESEEGETEDFEDEVSADEEELGKPNFTNNIQWSLSPDGTTLSISGVGDWETYSIEVADDEQLCPPWCTEENFQNVTRAMVDLQGETTLKNLFCGFKKLETVDLSKVDTSDVESLCQVFYCCESLKSVDLSSFNTSKVKELFYMFYNCTSLETIDLSNFDTTNVSSTAYMFFNCKKLKSVNVSNWNTSSFIGMNSMFRRCASLETLDLSNFDTHNVFDLSYFLSDCTSLKEIDLSSFSLESVSTAPVDCFANTSNLVYIKSPYKCPNYIILPKNGDDDIKWYSQWGTEVSQIAPNIDESMIFMRSDSELYKDFSKSEAEKLTENGIWGILDQVEYEYTGNAIKPEVKVYDGIKLLTKGVDYTVSYKNNKNVADTTAKKAPSVIITGKGNYKKTKKTLKFTIAPTGIENYYVGDDMITMGANGKVQKPALKFEGMKVTSKDYDMVIYEMSESLNIVGEPLKGIKDPGLYSVSVKGKGKFTGELGLMVKVFNKVSIEKVKITVPKVKVVNNAFKFDDIVVKDGKKLLKKGLDYTVKGYESKTINKLGEGVTTYTAYIEAVDGDSTSYFGRKEFTFTVETLPLSKATISGIPKSVEFIAFYRGILGYDEEFANVSVKYNGKELVKGSDYSTETTNNFECGTATIVFTGINGYSGTVKKTFKITPYDLGKNERGSISNYQDLPATACYSKGGATLNITLRSYFGELVKGKDYTVSYKNNKKLTNGSTYATAIIKGKGNYKGTYEHKFKIEAKNLGEVTMTVPDVKYSAKKGNFKAKITLTDDDGKKLKAGTDYEKEFDYYYGSNVMDSDGESILHKIGDNVMSTDIVPAGTNIIVKVKGKGCYDLENSKVYRVTEGSVSSAKITVKSKTYTGKAVTLTKDDITVKVGKKELVYGKDYVITGYTNNVSKGKANVTIKGIGNYGGSKKATFSIKEKAFNWLFAL